MSSSPCPSYLVLRPMDPGAGRTVYRIIVSAATVRDISQLLHGGTFLLSCPNSSYFVIQPFRSQSL
jgi:hypothetical protein